jgi:hypothetical protein
MDLPATCDDHVSLFSFYRAIIEKLPDDFRAIFARLQVERVRFQPSGYEPDWTPLSEISDLHAADNPLVFSFKPNLSKM